MYSRVIQIFWIKPPLCAKGPKFDAVEGLLKPFRDFSVGKMSTELSNFWVLRCFEISRHSSRRHSPGSPLEFKVEIPVRAIFSLYF